MEGKKLGLQILHVACRDGSNDGWDVAASIGFSVDLKEEVVEGFLEGCARDLRYMQARYKFTKHKLKMEKHYQYQSSSDCVLNIKWHILLLCLKMLGF